MNLQLVSGNIPEAKEYLGQRVVTFRDIDTVHQRPEGTASRNFREHQQYFVCGEDFFRVAGDELSRLKQATNFVGSNARELILITESGYLVLAKSFHDDLAWKVQRMLVKSYFRTTDQAEEKQLPPPGTTADILKANILTGKALAAAMGINEHQAVMAAIAKTERQTGDDLQEFKSLLTTGPVSGYLYGTGARLTPERIAVLKALTNAKRPLTPKQVASITGRGRNAVQKLLIKLREAGAVDIVRYGQYVLKESRVIPVKQ